MSDQTAWPALVFFLACLALLALAWYLTRARETKRLERLASWAEGLGYAIEAGSRPLNEAGLESGLTRLPIFRHGGGHKVLNLVRGAGPDGTELLFDHRFTIPAAKRSTTVDQTIAAFEVRAANLPAFELMPEGFLARIVQALGRPDIDFDSNPEFSRAYQLRGPDADAVRRLFERQAVSYMATTTGWSIQACGSWIVVFHLHRRHKPDDMTEFLEQARMLVKTIVWR